MPRTGASWRRSPDPFGGKSRFIGDAVRDNRGLRGDETSESDTVVGLTTYEIDGDRISMLRTEIDKGRGGRGLGTDLVRGALDDGRHLAILTFLSVRTRRERPESWGLPRSRPPKSLQHLRAVARGNGPRT